MIEPLVAEMQKLGEFSEPRLPRDISTPLVTYAVTQGKNLLTIGSGENKRLKTLMGNKGPHNKAPLVGLCHRLFPEPLRFYACRYTPSAVRTKSTEEIALQSRFGNTNLCGHTDYNSAMRYLRLRLGIKETQIEALLLDLMETHGDVLVHALATPSTAQIVESLFGGYWKRARGL